MIEALQFGCTKILETPTPSGDIALIRSREAAGPLDLSGCLGFFFFFFWGGFFQVPGLLGVVLLC